MYSQESCPVWFLIHEQILTKLLTCLVSSPASGAASHHHYGGLDDGVSPSVRLLGYSRAHLGWWVTCRLEGGGDTLQRIQMSRAAHSPSAHELHLLPWTVRSDSTQTHCNSTTHCNKVPWAATGSSHSVWSVTVSWRGADSHADFTHWPYLLCGSPLQ